MNSCAQSRFQSSISGTTASTTTKNLTSTQTNVQDAVNHPKLPPHSRLPTHMLLRSLLVSTISSSSLLLSSSLRFLTLVTNKRFAILDVKRNWLLHKLLKKTFYQHFCAGENLREVKSTVQDIKDIGFKGVILTYAREIVVDESTKQERGLGSQASQEGPDDLGDKEQYADVSTWRDGVMDTLEMLSEGDFLALKFTGAGESVAQSLRSNEPFSQSMQDALDAICTRALQKDVRILVDAEQQSLQSGVDIKAYDLMRKYNSKGDRALVYNTYQMYLKSSTANLNRHMEQAGQDKFILGVKLVRGAYIASEPRYLIHDTKEDTDRAYNESLKAIIERKSISTQNSTPKQNLSGDHPSIDLFVATHNMESASSAADWYQNRLSQNLPSVGNIQFGQLLGMADEVSCELLQIKDTNSSRGTQKSQFTGPDVYKCLSWGTLEDCLSYLLRRVVENKDAVLRTKSEAIAVRKEVWRRIKVSLGFAS